MGLISPNEMFQQAKEVMLDGHDPADKEDWEKIVNFFAHNIHEEMAVPACLLLAKIYKMPLTDDEIRQIAIFQIMSSRADRQSNGG